MGSLLRITGAVAPGKQCVAALKKQIFLVIESQRMSEIGVKKGRGDDGCELSVICDRAGECCGCVVAL